MVFRLSNTVGSPGLYRSGSTHFVATCKGTIQAADVLLATNGYTPKDLVPEVRRQVVPIGSYMVATVPLAPDVLDRLLPGNYIYWTQRRFLNYFRRSADDRLLFGGGRTSRRTSSSPRSH